MPARKSVKAMKRFSGTSNEGDFQEALANAIGTAKVSLKTDLVRWKLYSVAGENGGFVGTNDLTVTIQARGPGKK